MRIGIDLDNTLVDYTEAFLYGARQLELVSEGWAGERLQLKDEILQGPTGENGWQTLQGKVYGCWIGQANLNLGSYRFLWRCRNLAWTPIVVSHKTEFGHFDVDRIPLREAAEDFLHSRKVWNRDGSGLLHELRFESTRLKKIQAIINLRLDIFIDDLPEVLLDPNFPSSTRRILFDPANRYTTTAFEKVRSWEDLSVLLMEEWRPEELQALSKACGLSSVSGIEPVRGGGNSRVFCISTQSGSRYALKVYPPDCRHDRIRSEFDGFRALRLNGVESVPEPFGVDRDLDVAVFAWVDGTAIARPSLSEIDAAVDFLYRLQRVRSEPEFNDFPRASAACLSGKEIEHQLFSRIDLLRAENHKLLHVFLETEFVPLLRVLLDRGRLLWPESGFNTDLDRERQVLSPSDFGFHNFVRKRNGKLGFLDFEYFGWDDPVKLMCDFAFHPGMELDLELRRHWFRLMLRIFGDDLLPRLNAAWPLYGLCWALIVLNEFREDVWSRRRGADPSRERRYEAIQAEQFKRSRMLLERIESSVKTQDFDFS